MAARFCSYCKCLILPDNTCRNRDCVLGVKDRASVPQIEKIYQLCEELEISLSGKDPNTLTRKKASTLIEKLIKRKVHRKLYESEEM